MNQTAQEKDLVIIRDTFLSQMGMAHVQAALTHTGDLDALYGLLSEHLIAKGMARPLAAEGENNELALKLPGLPLHLRLSELSHDEVSGFITAAAIVAGVMGGGLGSVGVGVIAALATRLSVIKAAYGEVCLLEALSECKRPTQRNACAALYGSPCRRPKADCRFMQASDGACGFDAESVKATLQALCDKKIVQRLNATEPAEFGVVV